MTAANVVTWSTILHACQSLFQLRQGGSCLQLKRFDSLPHLLWYLWYRYWTPSCVLWCCFTSAHAFPPPPPGSGFDATKVWTSDGLWKGFLRCAKMMAKESGATSFIAMVQLPEKKLKEALANPLMKVRPRHLQTHHRLLHTHGCCVFISGGNRAVRLVISNGTTCGACALFRPPRCHVVHSAPRLPLLRLLSLLFCWIIVGAKFQYFVLSSNATVSPPQCPKIRYPTGARVFPRRGCPEGPDCLMLHPFPSPPPPSLVCMRASSLFCAGVEGAVATVCSDVGQGRPRG